jgi:large subunit ribosomal protein L22
MTGPKLNDGVLIAGDRPSTRATAKYLRGSASKAREVLDLIRGLDTRRADEVLQFTRRDVATEIRKVLASAVANAVHNDEQDADELFVVACYADEGPTLRRYRPRARGRATRIRKRTCHVTVIVARMSDRQLDIVQARQESKAVAGRRRAGVSARARRDRVERSRARAQGMRETAETAVETAETEPPEDAVVEEAEPAVEEVEAEEEVAADEVDEVVEEGEAESAVEAEEVAEEVVGEGDAESAVTEEAAVELPEGAMEAPEDGSIPEGHEIKGNANSMKYHVPGGRYYDVTIAEVFFDTAEHAEAAGYEAPAADTKEDED